jgi:hypothetical protein
MDRNFPTLRDAASGHAGGGRQAPPTGAPPLQFGAPPPSAAQQHGGSSSDAGGQPPGGLQAQGRERGIVATVKDSYAFIRCAAAPRVATGRGCAARDLPRVFFAAAADPQNPQGCGSLVAARAPR